MIQGNDMFSSNTLWPTDTLAIGSWTAETLNIKYFPVYRNTCTDKMISMPHETDLL